jgi:hypothetical protein
MVSTNSTRTALSLSDSALIEAAYMQKDVKLVAVGTDLLFEADVRKLEISPS